MDTVEFVKELLKDRHIPLSRVERDLGFSNGYIGRLRKGFFPPDRLVMIAGYLGVSPEYLSSCGNVVGSTSSAPSLSSIESELLLQFRRLDEFDRGKVAGFIEGLLESSKYTKSGEASAETA